jgi:hypothetical protein
VSGPEPQWHVAECLLPGLSRATAEALGRRVRRVLTGPPGSQVSFLGSLLMPQDEVLLCLFAGPEAEVRAVSERAGVPFERILACVAIGWRAGRDAAANEPPRADGAYRGQGPRHLAGGKDENSR